METFIFLSCLQGKKSQIADVAGKQINIKLCMDYYITVKGSKDKA